MVDHSISVVILAAGKGSRMRSDLPKVLQPLAGETLLGHVIRSAKTLKPRAITVVYGHGADQVRESFREHSLNWALQAQQLGTGHAVAQATAFMLPSDLVLVLYGDVPLVSHETLRRLVAAASRNSMSVLTTNLTNPLGYGRIVRQAGEVVRIVEQKDATPAEASITEVNTGLMCIPAPSLTKWLTELKNDNSQGEYYLTDVIELATRAGFPVHGVLSSSPSEVMGVNDKTELARAETTLRQREAELLLKAGVTLMDPLRIDVRGSVQVGRDVVIDTNVILEGRVVLGNRVKIATGCVLKDVVLGDDCEVLPYCILEGLTSDKNCRIGPFARIRPATKLAAHVHIGNFVEIKNSNLGEGSKSGHLAYLGDSSLGCNVNIGAGVVTANYDGAQKWRTTIEDGVFVGSGSMLVAPVTLKAGATIGAGSTITREAPAETLTLTRGLQVSKVGWKRPQKKHS